jgi:hypothetical protein
MMIRLVEVFKKERRRQNSLSRDMAQVVRGSRLITDIQNWAGTKNSTLRFPRDQRGRPARVLLHPKLSYSETEEAMVLQPAEALEVFVKLRDSIQEMVVAARADAKAGVVYTSDDLDPYWFEDSRR